MHRSGTSALARVINLLGCDVSDVLLPANEFNERGYWEDPYVLDLNERMLASAGLNWNSWEGLGDEWYQSGKAAQYADEALELIERRFKGSTLFVIKDPRIARLMPFWRNVMDELGVRTKVVFPIRRPAEVAASLQSRDHMNANLAQLVWLRYNLEAEYHSRGLDRAFLTYDQLLQDWRSTVDRVSDVLDNFTWPRRTAKIAAEIDTFLSSDLRHHVQTRGLTVDGSPWVRDVWTVLERFALGQAESEDAQVLDRVRSLLNEAEASFARVIMEFQRHGESLVARLDVADRRIGELTRAAETGQTESIQFAAANSVLEQTIRDAEEARVEQDAMREAELTQGLFDQASAAEAVTAARDEAERERTALQVRLEELAAAADQAQTLTIEVDGLRSRNADLEEEIRAQASEVIPLHEETERLLQERAALQARLDELGGTISHLEGLGGELEALREENAMLQERVRQNLLSLSALQGEKEDIERLKDETDAKLGAATEALARATALRSELSDIRDALADLERERERLSSENDRLLADRSSLLRELDGLRAELAQIGTEAAADESRLSSMAKALDDRERQVERLTLWLSSARQWSHRSPTVSPDHGKATA
jgi:FtsZ-binding cell division protein ZapB